MSYLVNDISQNIDMNLDEEHHGKITINKIRHVWTMKKEEHQITKAEITK